MIPPPPPKDDFQGVDDEKAGTGDQPAEVVLPVGPNAQQPAGPEPAAPQLASPPNAQAPSNPQNPVAAPGAESGQTEDGGNGQDVNAGADGNQGTDGQRTGGQQPGQGGQQQGDGNAPGPTAQFAPPVSVFQPVAPPASAFQPVDPQNPAAGSTPVAGAQATIAVNPNQPVDPNNPNRPVDPNNPNQPVDPNNPNAAVNANQPGVTAVPSPINLTPGANGQPTIGPITAMTTGTAMGEAFTLGPGGLVVVDGTTFNTATPTTKTLANGKTVKIGPTGAVSIQDKAESARKGVNKNRLFLSRADYVVGSFLPIILAVLFTIPWHILASALKEMEPFYQLHKPDGARADKSLALTYRASINIVSTAQAIGNGHYLVWWSGLLSLVALVLAPLSSETIFIAYIGEGVCDPLKSRANCIPQVSVFPAAARAVQAVLSFIAVLCLGLIIALLRKKSGIYTSPLSIASLAALFQDPRVVDDFRRIEGYYPPEAKDLRKALKGQTYKVGEYTDSLGNAQYGLHSLTSPSYSTGMDAGMIGQHGQVQERGIIERSTSVFSRSTFGRSKSGKSSKYTSVAVQPIDEEYDPHRSMSPQPTPAPFEPTMTSYERYGQPDSTPGIYSHPSPPPAIQSFSPPPPANQPYDPYNPTTSPPPPPQNEKRQSSRSPPNGPYGHHHHEEETKTPLQFGDGPPDHRTSDRNKRRREWFTLGTHSIAVIVFACLVLGLEFLILYYNKLPNTKAFERFMTQGSFGVNFLFTSLGVAIKMYWTMLDDDLRINTPYRLLHVRPHGPAHTVLSAPHNNPFTGFFHSLRHGEFLNAYASFVAVMCEVLIVALANIPFKPSLAYKAYVVCTWLCVSVLSLMLIGVVWLLVKRHGGFGLKQQGVGKKGNERAPETLGGVLWMLCGSRATGDFRGLSMEGRRERDGVVRGWGKMYSIGSVVGVDGVEREGVEESVFVAGGGLE